MREKPSRRFHHRITAPLHVKLPNGSSLNAHDWSIAGLRVDDWPGELPERGDFLEVELCLPFQGFNIGFMATLEVLSTRVPSRTVAGRLHELGERERDLMAHFLDEIVRGTMTEIDETIARIDVPVTPISTMPDPNPIDQIPVHRWPIRSVLMSLFYIFAGILVFGYSGILLYSNLFMLEIRSAVVSAPLETTRALSDGHIVSIRVRENDFIERNKIAITVRDVNLNNRTNNIRSEIRRHKNSLKTLQNTIEKRQNEAIFQIMRLSIQHARLQEKRRNGTPGSGLSLAKIGNYSLINKQLGDVDSKLSSWRLIVVRNRSFLNLLEGRPDKPVSTSQSFHPLEKHIIEVKDKLKKSKDTLRWLKDKAKRLHIRAPFNARINRILRLDGSTILKGDPLIVFEPAQPRQIHAWLNQNDILEIAEGSTASVFLPLNQLRFEAIVTRVNRTQGYLDETNARYRWRDPTDLAAQVNLEIPIEVEQSLLQPGMPAIVLFDRANTNSVFHDIGVWLGSFEPLWGGNRNAAGQQ